MSERSTFRPDLEGLRAVAVILVLLYHARLPGVPGGYIGVDVFFVLSGFLITGLLIRELSGTGRVDFPAFYARRVRRLLPAAAVTLLVTIVAAAVMIPPVRMPDVTGDTIAAGLYLSNMRFAIQATDYLGSTLSPSPVLHFWSLGVEEQFYVFWPALLALAGGAAFAAGRRETGLRRLGAALVAVFVLSLGFSLWLTSNAQAWAFFSLPARAWELALGGLLALPAAGRFVPRRAAPLLGWGGLALIVAAGLAFDDGTQFPGVAALLPTIGSALVIASGLVRPVRAAATEPAETNRSIRETRSPRAGGHDRGAAAGGSVLDRVPGPVVLLGLGVPRFLGRISYSLYLWHWPILVLPEAAVGAELPLPVRLALAAASIVVAALSQRYVEDPIRHGRFVGLGSPRSLVFAGALSIVIAVTALGSAAAAATRLDATGPVVGGSGTDVPLPSDIALLPSSGPTAPGASTTPSPTPSSSAATDTPPTPRPVPTLPPLQPGPVPGDLVPSLANALNDLPVIYADGCHLDQATTVLRPCVYGDPASARTVVLFGDSHAAQWFPAIQRLATRHDWRLVSLTKSGCTAAKVTVWDSIDKRPYTECDTWRQNALARIATEKPDLVIVSSSRAFQIVVNGQPDPAAQHPDLWTAGLRRTLATVHQGAKNVVLIGDTPRSTMDPPSCLSQHLSDASACAVAYADAVDAVTVGLQAQAAATTVSDWIDPTTWVCRSDPCPAIYGRFLIYRDQGHLTATYSKGLSNELYAALPPIGP